LGPVDNQAAAEAVRTLKYACVHEQTAIGAVEELHAWLAAGYAKPALRRSVEKALRRFDPSYALR